MSGVLQATFQLMLSLIILAGGSLALIGIFKLGVDLLEETLRKVTVLKEVYGTNKREDN